FLHTPEHRAGLGGITPTTFATGYLYAGMGWTTVNEAAVPLLSARHTHEELHDTPIVDKSCLVLMANNEIVLDLIEQGEVERARHVVAWLIWAAKAYGVKAVNPGGIVNWKFGRNANSLTEPVDGYTRTVRGSTCSMSSPGASGAISMWRMKPGAESFPTCTKSATWSTPCSGPSDWSCCCSSAIPGGSFSRRTTPTARASGGTRRSSI